MSQVILCLSCMSDCGDTNLQSHFAISQPFPLFSRKIACVTQRFICKSKSFNDIMIMAIFNKNIIITYVLLYMYLLCHAEKSRGAFPFGFATKQQWVECVLEYIFTYLCAHERAQKRAIIHCNVIRGRRVVQTGVTHAAFVYIVASRMCEFQGRMVFVEEKKKKTRAHLPLVGREQMWHGAVFAVVEVECDEQENYANFNRLPMHTNLCRPNIKPPNEIHAPHNYITAKTVE